MRKLRQGQEYGFRMHKTQGVIPKKQLRCSCYSLWWEPFLDQSKHTYTHDSFHEKWCLSPPFAYTVQLPGSHMSHRRGQKFLTEMPFLNLFPWEHTIMDLTAKPQHWILILCPQKTFFINPQLDCSLKAIFSLGCERCYARVAVSKFLRTTKHCLVPLASRTII